MGITEFSIKFEANIYIKKRIICKMNNEQRKKAEYFKNSEIEIPNQDPKQSHTYAVTASQFNGFKL